MDIFHNDAVHSYLRDLQSLPRLRSCTDVQRPREGPPDIAREPRTQQSRGERARQETRDAAERVREEETGRCHFEEESQGDGDLEVG